MKYIRVKFSYCPDRIIFRDDESREAFRQTGIIASRPADIIAGLKNAGWIQRNYRLDGYSVWSFPDDDMEALLIYLQDYAWDGGGRKIIFLDPFVRHTIRTCGRPAKQLVDKFIALGRV